MIRNYEEKVYAENRIAKLEKILLSLKEDLLPDREEQYKAMAKVYVSKIRVLREEIEEFTGMSLLNMKRRDLNLHIVGPAIDYGVAPVSILTKYLADFKSALQQIYISLYGGTVNNYISKLFDMGLYEYNPGSINVSLQFENQQISLLENNDNSKITHTLDVYFKIIQWMNTDDILYIRDMSEEQLRNIVANMIKTMPDNKKIRSISFESDRVDIKTPVTVTSGHKKKMKEYISSVSNEYVIIVGDMRELDLDKNTFWIRNIGDTNQTQKCKFKREMLEDIANCLGYKVTVEGILKKNYLVLNQIEIKE